MRQSQIGVFYGGGALQVSENSGGPVEFRWIEEYESREAMESDEYTDV